MAYMFSLKDRYQSFKRDFKAFEQEQQLKNVQGAIALPKINSFGSSSKFKKNKARQFKYDRNQRIIR